jgi:prophage regulatory protein
MAAITAIKPVKDETFTTPSTIRFLKKREVMHRTGLSSSGIYDLIKRGLFPPQIKLSGGKSVVWLESSINEYMMQCLEQSKSQGAA